MARELQPLERQRIIWHDANIAAGQTLFAAMGLATNPVFNVHGHFRVAGNFHMAAGMAPAAGFPRIRQSNDQGTSFSIVDVIPQDFTQPDVQFPFDIEVRMPFITIELTNGAVLGVVRVSADVFPE